MKKELMEYRKTLKELDELREKKKRLSLELKYLKKDTKEKETRVFELFNGLLELGYPIEKLMK